MRILLLIFISFPIFSGAQVNRSANELAREQVQEYIVTMIFKAKPYKPIYYGELTPQNQPHSEIVWSIHHKFEIVDSQFVSDKKVAVIKPYNFSFFLDKKLKVIGAESFLRE